LAESAKPAQSALFAAKLLPNLPKRANGLIVWDQPDSLPFAKRWLSSSCASRHAGCLLGRRRLVVAKKI
jgi:hypothetical protein